jgi:citrate synthase
MVPVPGKLFYRGIDIDDIIKGFMDRGDFGFEETGYLLLFGDLPNKGQLEEFKQLLSSLRCLPDGFVRDTMMNIPSTNMLNAMARCVLALYGLDENADDTSVLNVLAQCLKLIAVFPLIAVYSYQAYAHYHGQQSLIIHNARPDLSTAENILHMLRPDSSFTQLEAQLLDLSLVLHAEHGGGNNSSFVTHVVTSSGTDTYSSIAAALGSLKGPRHGGANIKVVEMIDDLKQNLRDWEDDDEIAAYLQRILSKEAFDKSGLIYGMGHAVYSISDPRAIQLREQAHMLAKAKGYEREFNLYAKVENLAPQIIGKMRRIYKGVSANVDFYSGFVYEMLDIPRELFTPLFAISRIVGWSAHRIEEITNGGKIIRPAYKSVAKKRSYIPLEERS